MYRKGIGLLLSIASVGILSSTHAWAEDVSAVINVNSSGMQTTLPTIQGRPSENVVIDVNNNLCCPVTLEVPDIGVRYTVGAMRDQSFFFKLSQMPRNDVPYLIRDVNGNILSNGRIAILETGCPTASLDRIINYSTAYAAENKPQPVYYPVKPVKHKFIRGYW